MEKKLSPMEYKYMEFIWKFPQGVYSNLIYDEFPQAQGTKGAILLYQRERLCLSPAERKADPLYPAD